ncbi:unnamed protein product [Spirodela intermedia]|uniref:Uncharacterized protein n=1 Tax=Spirodela intermedia TaxID=51605 RepID=A0A7I8JKR8_SPIIN|nr:unnamed protein product [Spirodela intermedia]CAA6670729.1 unnamed protein product [Spirodela intermedia]
MEVPVGFLAKLWSFVSFLPFFLLLLTLGVAKDFLHINPLSLCSSNCWTHCSSDCRRWEFFVIIGLWPAHFIWTYFCIGNASCALLLMSIVTALLLLFLCQGQETWTSLEAGHPSSFANPSCAVASSCHIRSLTFGLGYGYCAPLIATFEAVGEEVADKLYHCFADGCQSTVKGACTVVRDCTDFCFHSYFSYMDDLRERALEDVPMIAALALLKSPYMLLKGWQRLIQDLIGREGPFLETVCVPFAGLAIILWPIAVIGAVICAFFCSFFLATYSAVVAYQEDSVQMGLAYIVSVISMFDEYSNDLLYLREGSYLPRPVYRKEKDNQKADQDRSMKSGSKRGKLVSEQSLTLRRAFQQLKPIQIWDWLFRSCEQNGRMLVRDGLIDASDIADCILKGRCEKLTIKLPAWCILQCLLRSAESDSYGLLITDDLELTDFNWPKDKVLGWFLEPLLIMKEQIKGLQLSEDEAACLRKLIMVYNSGKPDDWNGSGFPSDDNVRRAQIQAILRRLQGIVSSLSRLPTFRRRFLNLTKILYLETLEAGALSREGGSPASSSVKSSEGVPRVSDIQAADNIV